MEIYFNIIWFKNMSHIPYKNILLLVEGIIYILRGYSNLRYYTITQIYKSDYAYYCSVPISSHLSIYQWKAVIQVKGVITFELLELSYILQ